MSKLKKIRSFFLKPISRYTHINTYTLEICFLVYFDFLKRLITYLHNSLSCHKELNVKWKVSVSLTQSQKNVALCPFDDYTQ